MIKLKKEKIIILALILVMVVSIIGVSYAAYNYSKTGTKLNSITTGTITMSYIESDNVISIDKALPTTDETGKVRLKEGEYFDFTISSEIVGDTNINYEISAKDVTTSERKIDGSNIKLYLTKITEIGEEELMNPSNYKESIREDGYTGRPANEMSLYASSMSSSETNKYRLRMYVDEDYNPQGDGGELTFSVRINAYGNVGLSKEERMMKGFSETEAFYQEKYRTKISSIVTKQDKIVPETAIESWDISGNNNGTTVAYIEDDEKGTGTYKLTLCGDKTVVAPEDSTKLFSGFTSLETLDLTYLDTSKVTNMERMFEGCSNLTSIDVSNFDTSKVIDMRGMFNKCSNLKNLDVSNFDTSNVTTMRAMFQLCSSLTELDLSNFDTSKVTDIAYMFNKCSNLKNLDVSNFDTSNVTTMLAMFQLCSSLTELDLSNFNTSNVTDMAYMINSCYKLQTLNMSQANFSKVTSYKYMFWSTNGTINVIVKDNTAHDFIRARLNDHNLTSATVTIL